MPKMSLLKGKETTESSPWFYWQASELNHLANAMAFQRWKSLVFCDIDPNAIAKLKRSLKDKGRKETVALWKDKERIFENMVKAMMISTVMVYTFRNAYQWH